MELLLLLLLLLLGLLQYHLIASSADDLRIRDERVGRLVNEGLLLLAG